MKYFYTTYFARRWEHQEKCLLQTKLLYRCCQMTKLRLELCYLPWWILMILQSESTLFWFRVFFDFVCVLVSPVSLCTGKQVLCFSRSCQPRGVWEANKIEGLTIQRDCWRTDDFPTCPPKSEPNPHPPRSKAYT